MDNGHGLGVMLEYLKGKVASTFLVNEGVLESWMLSLNSTRNICAHHGRLWNRILPIKPLMPRKNKRPEWHSPVVVANERIFGTLTILGYMLSLIAPKSLGPQIVPESLLGRDVFLSANVEHPITD